MSDMKSILRGIDQCLKSLWSDERGQSTTEYILILSVVVMIAMKFRSTFSTKMTSMLGTLGTQLESGVTADGGP